MDGIPSFEDKIVVPTGWKNPPTLLVVDDDTHVCKLLEFHFRRSGCAVETVFNGKDAVTRIQQGEPVDVVLLDLMLPDMKGLDVLKEIVETKKVGFVVVMSSQGAIEDAPAAIRLGAFDFVKKTSGFDELRLAVRNALSALLMLAELQSLRARLDEADRFPELIGKSEPMRQMLKLVEKVASRDITVLIEGESGTGKELIARAIHFNSPRASGPFVPINCAAIPENLMESELFGHEKGAFTGATARRVGKFEKSDGGTLFLDEVGELPSPLQAKLLRVLQSHEIEPIGGQTKKVDVRILSATNVDLALAVTQGRFRQDLYYRLAVFPIFLPPLRSRGEDILLLARHFLEKFCNEENRELVDLSPKVEQALMEYSFQGNVRELENMIFRAVVVSESMVLEWKDFPVLALPPGGGGSGGAGAPFHNPNHGHPPAPQAHRPAFPPPHPEPPVRRETRSFFLKAAEADTIRQAIRETAGNVSRAAELLGISRVTLYRKAKKLNIPLK
ncbi:MAG: sigma-54 dependent transcriptional regulator [Deltaproteobacteria bacterium]|nr:sigma-54 dependent transcriptional regulator [Deltaproteobacteria bacterium]